MKNIKPQRFWQLNFNHRGLTLIELLVVISIIALIATVAMVAIKDSRGKANDAKRVYDIQQYVKALQLYNLEHKHYPYGADDCAGSSCSGQLGWAKNQPPNNVLAPFFADLPADPKANGNTGAGDYFYYYNQSNSRCSYKPTVSVQNMETNKAEYHYNPCVGDSAAYLMVID